MNTPLRTTLAWVAGAAAALVALVFAAQLVLAPLANDALKRLVDERSEGRYRLATGELDLSLWRGRVALHDVSLTPDTTELVGAAKLTDGVALSAEVERLAISGVSWWQLLVNQRISADSVTVAEPEILARAYLAASQDSTADLSPGGSGGNPSTGSSDEQLPVAIAIDGIRIQDARVRYELLGGRDTSSSSRLAATGVDVTLSGFSLDSLTFRRRPTRFYDRFAIAVGGYRHELGDSLHVVTLGAARFASDDGRLTLDGLRVEPRDTGFSFRENHPRARLALALSCDTVKLRGFDLGEFLRTQRYRARRLEVDSADATAWVAGDAGSGDESDQTPADSSGGFAFDLRLDTLALDDATLHYRARAPDLAIDLPGADVTLTDVRSRPGDNRRPFSVAEIDLGFRDFRYAGAGIDNELEIASGRLSLAGQRLRVDSLRYAPPDPDAFARDNRVTFDLSLASLQLDSLDVPTLFWQRRVAAHRAAVGGLRIVSTTNFAQPAPPDDPVPLLLRELQTLPIGLALDLVTVEDGYVGYRRLGGDVPDATIFWDELYATFGRVGTAAAYVSDYPRATVDIRAAFQSIWPLKLTAGWPNGAGVPYEVTVSGEALELARLNDLLGPVANLRVEHGTLDTLALNFTADTEGGRGELTATYRDLNVELLEDGPAADKRSIFSFLANTLAVHDENVPGESDYRVGKIDVARQPDVGMFTHWWELVRAGLTEVALTDFGQSQVQQ